MCSYNELHIYKVSQCYQLYYYMCFTNCVVDDEFIDI